MLRLTRRRLFQRPTNGDGRKSDAQIKRELGMWKNDKEETAGFLRWCSRNCVQLRGAKVTSCSDWARCLRATSHIPPGGPIVIAPLRTAFNFLVCVRHHLDKPNYYPFTCTSNNWNELVRPMPGLATHELYTSGWLARHYFDDEAFFHPYARWLAQDTTGKNSMMQGIATFREDAGVVVIDDLFAKLANEAGIEQDDYMDPFLKCMASVLGRSYPLDVNAIEESLHGTGFFSMYAPYLSVPTLVPLVDCIPNIADGAHNVACGFYSRRNSNDVDIMKEVFGLVNADQESYFVVRALREIQPGDFITQRDWPRATIVEDYQSKVVEAQRMQSFSH
eukprot:PhM_4_TR11363/c0_g1_i1/m.58916